MHREGKHVLSHAGIYLVARGVPGIMAFLSFPLFTRLLLPADYGRYALVVATVGLLNALLFQWLRLSLVRYLPAYKDNAAPLKSTLAAMTGALVVGLGVIAAILCLLPITRVYRPIILPCWIMLASQAFFELASEYTRAMIQPWRYMAIQVARSAALVVLGAAFILMGAKWWGPLAGASAGMALSVAWLWRTDWAGVRLMLDRPTLAKLFHYGVPISVTVALTIVISSSDRFLIAFFRGEEAAGLYSVAVDFTSQTLMLLMMVINLAMFPIAVRALEHQGKEAAQAQMKVNASLMMAIGVPGVVGLAILAPGLANCFFGEKFRGPAAAIIPLIGLGAFLAAFKAYHFDAAFQFAHRTIHQVWIVLGAAILNVAFNVVAIPRFGINGSAVASVLAYLVSIALTIYFGRRYFVLPFPFDACVRVLAASLVMGALLLLVRDHRTPFAVMAQIAAGGAVYGMVLVATNFLELRDTVQRKLARWRNQVPSLTRRASNESPTRQRGSESVNSKHITGPQSVNDAGAGAALVKAH